MARKLRWTSLLERIWKSSSAARSQRRWQRADLGPVEALESRALLAADLVPYALSTTSPNLTPGSLISLNYETRNVGDQTAFLNYSVSLYLSRDQFFGSLIYLGEARSSQPHAAGTGISGQGTYFLPFFDSPFWEGDGTYYVVFMVDSYNEIFENNDVNFGYGLGIDQLAVTVTGTPWGPDLIGTGFTVTPGTIAPSAQVTINYQVTNQGFQTSQTGYLSLYLGRDFSVNSGDDLFLANVLIPNIAGFGAVHSGSVTVTLPGPESPFWNGSSYATIGMFIDIFDFQIYETNNANNGDRGFGLDLATVRDVTIESFDSWAPLPSPTGGLFNAWLQTEADNLTKLIADVQRIETAAIGIASVRNLSTSLQARKNFITQVQQQVQWLRTGVASTIYLSSTITMDMVQLNYIDRFLAHELYYDFLAFGSGSAVPLRTPRVVRVDEWDEYYKNVTQPLRDLNKQVANGVSQKLTQLSETLQGLVGNNHLGARIQAQVVALREGITTAITQGTNAIYQNAPDGKQVFENLKNRIQSEAWDKIVDGAVDYLDSKFDNFSQYWEELQGLQGMAETVKGWVDDLAPYFDAIQDKVLGTDPTDPDDPKPPKNNKQYKGAWKGDLASQVELSNGQTITTETDITVKLKDNRNGSFKGKLSFPMLQLDGSGNVIGKMGKTTGTFNVETTDGNLYVGYIELKSANGQQQILGFAWNLQDGVLSGALYDGSLSTFTVRR